jgi:NAD(P)-dependent dehydrogenase (short-subunit alcohol dehydrogenase family)
MKLSNDLSAIVSGGASGLGEATARALAAAGVGVAILDCHVDRGETVARETGGFFASADVSDPASVRAAIASATARLGPLRIAVCCAGIGPAARTVDRHGTAHDPDLFTKVIGVNLLGTFNVASQAAAIMSGLAPVGDDGERGVIVTTASVAAFEGQIGQIAYAASKGAVTAMTLPMARDLAGRGIRVVSIAPGLFRTPMLAGLPQEAQESLGAQVPFPARLGDPGEFAELVLHIVENAMLNGAVIRLDGAIRMAPR